MRKLKAAPFDFQRSWTSDLLTSLLLYHQQQFSSTQQGHAVSTAAAGMLTADKQEQRRQSNLVFLFKGDHHRSKCQCTSSISKYSNTVYQMKCPGSVAVDVWCMLFTFCSCVILTVYVHYSLLHIQRWIEWTREVQPHPEKSFVCLKLYLFYEFIHSLLGCAVPGLLG